MFTESEDVTGLALTGAEFDALSAVKQKEAVRNARLFARVEPVRSIITLCMQA